MKSFGLYKTLHALLPACLRIRVKNPGLLVTVCLVSLVLSADCSHAALFSQLTKSGSEIFEGMKEIIYAVAGFGIVGIAIGGFFGNLNWKWLSAIIIGLIVIAGTAGILMYMTESDLDSAMNITDSLKTAG